MNKEIRKLIKELEAQGFEIKPGGSGHPKVYRDGRYLTTLPSTPSDWRAVRNAVAVLKRHGYRP